MKHNNDFLINILEEIQKIKDYLGDGKAVSFEEYKKMSGEIAGLKKSLNLYSEFLMKIMKDDYYE